MPTYNAGGGGGGGGIPDPVVSDINLDDDIYITFGDSQDNSLGYNVTGQSTPGLWLGLTTVAAGVAPILVIGEEANKGFDFTATNLSGFISDPTVFIQSGDQALNEYVFMQVEGSARTFNINAASGDSLSGVTSTANGVGHSMVTGDGGTSGVGGDGGDITYTLGGGGGTAGNAGNFYIFMGGGSGTGNNGEIAILAGGGQRLFSLDGDGEASFLIEDNNSQAFSIASQPSSPTYFNISTSNGNENISLGNATTNPSVSFLGSGDITFGEGIDFVLGTTTGTKIGTGATEKLAFYGDTPIVQPTTGIAEAAFVENAGGTAVNVDSTFGGYTLQQIAQALQNLGLLA